MEKIKGVRIRWVVTGCRIMQRESKLKQNRKQCD
jgi:hypothetical protein